jgi:hypothetical protein
MFSDIDRRTIFEHVFEIEQGELIIPKFFGIDRIQTNMTFVERKEF